MGISLTVIPEPGGIQGKHPDSYTRLAFSGRHGIFFDKLEEAASPIEGILWYGDDGLRLRKTNPYGRPILKVTASTLLRLWKEFASCDKPWDWAIISFIAELDEDATIYLWFY